MRKKVIAGNWKMNMLPNEAMNFINGIAPVANNSNAEVILCVPYTDLFYSLLTVQDTKIKIGAQNMHWETSGAYTGEISADMLKCINVEYVIIGHSERRQYFNETDETVNLKIKKALISGLKPIVCVGENLEQRQLHLEEDVIEKQIKKALEGIQKEDLDNIIIAYEPIWAIGTGNVATKEDANNMMKVIRRQITKLYNEEIAQKIILLYGGSVNKDNSKELFDSSDIDGGLVGGASLKASEFEEIIKNAE